MEKEFKIYHTETQEDYDDLMIKLEKEGCMWASGDKPTSKDYWNDNEEDTVIYLNEIEEDEISRGVLGNAKKCYYSKEVIKHKAKGVEQMEKVVVPQFVADWYKEVKGDKRTLYNTLSALKHSENVEVCDWYKGDDTLDIHENFYKKQQIIAKMHLYGYEVEEEKKYYWRKKKEYCLGFETEDEVFIRYYYKKNKMYLGNRPVYLFLVPSYEPYKTKFTEKEVRELVSEEDFNKLEKVEIADDEC